eukprot:CAMPEP_0173396946 /NCGR_PEP_ID=MMETSP1356-20130122/36976_1 /TAXON_ID=77927 ORGANISM="Hemiselmis virescens, Strain PCC157" /NCGR_SAMPLE_ID=MMETSP1356 /ASSEMBLY_ACC=CAM_ASM_000847 /LENGTH=47 /DNA_ID= /DNA_START= /DNA_END= /DNA_ORIENTATION=
MSWHLALVPTSCTCVLRLGTMKLAERSIADVEGTAAMPVPRAPGEYL